MSIVGVSFWMRKALVENEPALDGMKQPPIILSTIEKCYCMYILGYIYYGCNVKETVKCCKAVFSK